MNTMKYPVNGRCSSLRLLLLRQMLAPHSPQVRARAAGCV